MSIRTAILNSNSRPLSFHQHCFSRFISSSSPAAFRFIGNRRASDAAVFNEYMSTGAFIDEKKTVNGANPPGLRFIPKLLSEADEANLLKDAYTLNDAIQAQANKAIERQATTYLSQQHNLTSKESYRLVSFDNGEGRKLSAQHFKRYGEDGHELTYFINNDNIPSFVKRSLISSVEKLSEVQALKAGQQTLQWNFTFNVYIPDPKSSLVPGFPFHIDTPKNGEITAIFTLLNSAELQMRRKEEAAASFSTMLTPGSIVVLSGEARWSWLHRVVPQKIVNSPTHDLIHRMSLVVGCHLPK